MDQENPPSSPKSLTNLAFERLRAEIIGGKLAPEERLRIKALSDRYAIGTTAIREALSRLVADGLVESEDQRGFCVAPVSREELLDLTETRIEIEQVALARSMKLGDVEWETRVISAFHRLSRTPMPAPGDATEAISQAHRLFHEALLSGSGSVWTLRICRLLFEKSERYRHLAGRYMPPTNRDSLGEHRRLMEAVLSRDEATSCRLISDHFWTTTDIILKAKFGDATSHSGPARTAVAIA